LHRFQWLTDDVIGSLPVTWNYLEGWYTSADCEEPIAVHYTRGGPWFDNWRHVEYANEWTAASKTLVPLTTLTPEPREKLRQSPVSP
jgi:hypothetical protein